MLTALTFVAGIIILVFVALLGGTIIIWIWRGKISLFKLISEANGDASLSRLQFLIFTFVIALSLFLVIVGQTTPAFPEKISPDVLSLLGISAGSYLVSKGIQFSNPAGVARPALVISPPKTTGTVANAAVPLTVSIANAPPGATMPQITWSLDAPAEGTIIPIPPNAATYNAPAVLPAGGLTASVRAKAPGFDEATATIA